MKVHVAVDRERASGLNHERSVRPKNNFDRLGNEFRASDCRQTLWKGYGRIIEWNRDT